MTTKTFAFFKRCVLNIAKVSERVRRNADDAKWRDTRNIQFAILLRCLNFSHLTEQTKTKLTNVFLT